MAPQHNVSPDSIIRIFVVSVLVILASMAINNVNKWSTELEFNKVKQWLLDNELEEFTDLFDKQG